MTRSSRFGLSCVAAGWLAVMLAIAPGAQAQVMDGFDHIGTRFPLTGAHTREPCESCHVGGLFRGTPTRCSFCHDGTGQRAETSKDRDHIQSGNDCEFCHATLTWKGARFDHSTVSGSCASCHDGRTAEGKPNDHVKTRSDCDLCHRTLTWNSVRFDHSDVSGRCSSCHDGREATGKPNDHIRTKSECDVCHRTRSWDAARFDHSDVEGACSSCHDGNTATGKHRKHIKTTAECDLCHRTRAWDRVRFDHSGVNGSCDSCHNGRDATGKPNDHFVTDRNCQRCHDTNTWSRIRFTHRSPDYPSGHRGSFDCNDCHRNNREDRPWTNPSYAPDCAGCHAGDFERDEHKKVDTPKQYYSVSELRDCTGSCHIYKDASLSQIEERRNRQHRVGDSEFDD